MAGAGYKLYATGDILTAAQVNNYLQEQTVMVFADAAARTTALASVLAEGMISYLKDTNSTEYYSGSAWTAIGGGASGGMTLLSTTTLSGSSTTISSISGSYKNLLIVVKGLYGSTNDAGSWMRFNGDSGATQYAMNSVCNNRGTIRLEQTVTDKFVNFFFSNPSSNTNVAKNGTGTIYIPRYTDTSATFMTANTMSGYDTNDNTSAMFYQGIYKSSAAITSVTFGIYVGTFSGGTVYVYGEN